MNDDTIGRIQVGMLVADGTEQIEVTAPRDVLRQAGATVDVLSPDGRDIRGYHYIEPADMIPVDGTIGGTGTETWTPCCCLEGWAGRTPSARSGRR